MRLRRLPTLLAVLPLLACALPRAGTPVFVDLRAGDFWSGEGVLVEVSEDEKRCRVAVRERSLLVRKRWVDCAHVHARSSRHTAVPKSSFK
jgi:hypothetical protein